MGRLRMRMGGRWSPRVELNPEEFMVFLELAKQEGEPRTQREFREKILKAKEIYPRVKAEEALMEKILPIIRSGKNTTLRIAKELGLSIEDSLEKLRRLQSRGLVHRDRGDPYQWRLKEEAWA